MMKRYAHAQYVAVTMVVVWLFIGIHDYQKEYFVIFTLIQLAASWNVYAFLSGKCMVGYGLMRSMRADEDGVLRGFLFVMYIIIYLLFLYVYLD